MQAQAEDVGKLPGQQKMFVESEVGLGHRLTDMALIYRYLAAGKGKFTLRNGKTGRRVTFEVESCGRKDDKGEPTGPMFLSAAVSGKLQYFGCMWDYRDRATAGWAYGKKSKLARSAVEVQTFAWFWDHVKWQVALPAHIEFWHEGRCAKCGSDLTVPESIVAGFGPKCLKMIQLKVRV